MNNLVPTANALRATATQSGSRISSICLLEIGISSPDIHVISIDLAFGWHEPVPEHVLYCLGTCVLKTTGDEHEGT